MGGVPPVTFGPGRLAHVPKVVAELCDGPVMVIADSALATLGVTDRLSENLGDQGVVPEIAAEITGEPKEALIDDLRRRARHIGAEVVIGLGGGSAMDAAKLVAALAHSDKPTRDFALAARPLPADGLPAVAVPTTAGTGSEVTRTAIVSTPAGAKNWYYDEELMFAHAVLDPELTLSLPAHLTAWTGIDAVAHALEASTARATNSAGLLYGLEALRILSDALPRAVADGADVEARGQVLWASAVAGLALHNCNTHMGHNISHALGSLVRVHHGLATGLALAAALPWLVERPEGATNYALASKALGGTAQADGLPEAFAALMQSCGIAAELPDACSGLSAATLAKFMKRETNYAMSQNAACPVSSSDLDELSERMMALPLAGAP